MTCRFGTVFSAVFASICLAFTAYAAEYPRKAAIAPFETITKEDIAQTVLVLPRLLSSRLMALAGVDVTLLPPGDKAPLEQARATGAAILLQGTVAKLGKGYSIDLNATEVESGKPAGAFFASAATEDEIIPQLGVLSAEITEKLFGVKAVVRTAPVSVPAAVPQGATAASPNAGAPVTPPPVSPGIAAAEKPSEIVLPKTFKRASKSDRVVDEIFGVVAGDLDNDGNGEIVAYGKRTIYLYKIKGLNLLPSTRITRDANHHILNVETIDIDGDGRKEILVTDLVGESVFHSFVLKRNGDVYEQVAGDIPLFLAVLPDWMGKKVVIGQRAGFENPFTGRIVTLGWDGKTLKESGVLPPSTDGQPLSSGIPGFSAARLGSGWRFLYVDESEHLRVLDAAGKTEYKSKNYYGSPADGYEWGTVDRVAGKKRLVYLRKAPRPFSVSDLHQVFIAPVVEKSHVTNILGSHEGSRLVLVRWDGGEFVEMVATERIAGFYSAADVVLAPGSGGRGRVVASVIEEFGNVLKPSSSRLELLEGE